jgi:hypothetical protein
MGSHEAYRHMGVEMTINKAFSLHSTLQIWSNAQEDLLLTTITPRIFTEMAGEPQMPRHERPGRLADNGPPTQSYSLKIRGGPENNDKPTNNLSARSIFPYSKRVQVRALWNRILFIIAHEGRTFLEQNYFIYFICIIAFCNMLLFALKVFLSKLMFLLCFYFFTGYTVVDTNEKPCKFAITLHFF